MRQKQLTELMERWRSYYVGKGISEADTSLCLDYVARLLRQDLPPLLDLDHLSRLVGLKYDLITAMSYGSDRFYRQFQIPKRRGGMRTIMAPYPSLKYVQTWIYDHILSRVKVHGCVHGFVARRSILSNARAHCRQDYLLKLDIEDFFGSITQNQVVNIFMTMGYNRQIAHFLSTFCCLGGVLPQGAPTSPALSNIISLSLDRRLYRLARRFELNYTRYADDIAFSGTHITPAFIGYATSVINQCGLRVNTDKTRLYGPHGSKILTGVSLATGEPRLPRDYRRRLTQTLHYVEQYGLKGHMAHNHIGDAGYINTLLGQLNYWLMIEPGNPTARHYQEFLVGNCLYE